MELKLQQAIIATRAGQTEIAQSLLAQHIREEPEDANAWFLLSHLVNSQERRSRYLTKTISLDPTHGIAKQHLAQPENLAVLTPVPPKQEASNTAVTLDANKPVVDLTPNEPVINEDISINQTQEVATAELPEWLQNLDNKQLGSQSSDKNRWLNTAAMPVREIPNVDQQRMIQPVLSSIPHDKSTSKKTPGEIWLIRILIIMVIVAAIVLVILVFLIIFQT